MMIKSFCIALLCCFTLLGFATPALAHSLQTNFYLRGNILELQASFSTGEVFADAPVVIYPPSGSNLAPIETQTNAEGVIEFAPDYTLAGDWGVEIGEENHWDFLTIPVGSEGIDLNTISQHHPDAPHRHYYVAQQIVVFLLVLGLAFVSPILNRRLFQ
ncbi:MAG: hypothetical protein EA366_08875 [Spirulina sp. DLM2.Bin59]|nr:MAG: hypothetical protein EA366_08875 [Spirulina sp. DLM2.Bin59]